MKKFLILALLLICPQIANAQSQRNPCYNTGSNNCIGVGTSTPLPVTGTFSSTVTGFHTESSLSPITATTGGVSSSAFTAGKGILASNTGSTNTAYCAPGASATTSSTPILPGQTVQIQTTSETAVTCITSSSTTTVSFQVGTGLATGWGGSGSGGGGGAVTVADGADVTEGAKADAACGTDTGTCTLVALAKRSLQSLTTLNSNITAAIPAGTNLIGKVGIDQTTPGTTNGVQVNAALPAGTNIVGYTSNDPCSYAAKTNLPIASNTSALTQIIGASGSTKIYICSLAIISASAEWVTFNTGTGTNCGTGTTGLIGGTTVGTNGLSLPANGGLTLGNGAGTVAVTGAGGEVCIALSGTTYVSGNLTYVQQ